MFGCKEASPTSAPRSYRLQETGGTFTNPNQALSCYSQLVTGTRFSSTFDQSHITTLLSNQLHGRNDDTALGGPYCSECHISSTLKFDQCFQDVAQDPCFTNRQ
jgi:hypothetical protein